MATTHFPGVALVTGAGGKGIGNAIAVALAKEGCKRIAIADIRPDTLKETTEELEQISSDIEILSQVTDISDASQVDLLFNEIMDRFGRLDYVNNAGIIGPARQSSDLSTEDFEKINGVNYKGVWLCSKRELQIMKEQEFLPGTQPSPRRQRGAIVNIASQLGIVGRPDAPAYCASKSAVIGLTRCDAIDHSKYNIRINAVCPGIIGTPMNFRPELASTEKDPYAWLNKEISIVPMRRVGLPEEIAEVVTFLCSERASFVQGAAWVADGGYIIQ